MIGAQLNLMGKAATIQGRKYKGYIECGLLFIIDQANELIDRRDIVER